MSSSDTEPVSARVAPFKRLSSVKLAAFLTRLTFPDGRVRWDARRGAARRCLHCGSAHDVKRHLCCACRTARDPFLLTTADVGPENYENPYVVAGGYRWCQRQCSGVPLPLDFFPAKGGKKCVKCANARRMGLATNTTKLVSRARVPAVTRRRAAEASAPRARKQRRRNSPSPSSSSTPEFGPTVPPPQLSPLRTRSRPPRASSLKVTTITTMGTATWAQGSRPPAPLVMGAPPLVDIPPLVEAPVTPVLPPPRLVIPKMEPPTPTGTDFGNFLVALGAVAPADIVRARSLDDSHSSSCTVPLEPSPEDEATADLMLGDATPMGLAALDTLLDTL